MASFSDEELGRNRPLGRRIDFFNGLLEQPVEEVLRVDKRDDLFEIEELKRSQCGALASFSDEELGRNRPLGRRIDFFNGLLEQPVEEVLRVDKRDDLFEIEELKRSQCGALASFSDEELGRNRPLGRRIDFFNGLLRAPGRLALPARAFHPNQQSFQVRAQGELSVGR